MPRAFLAAFALLAIAHHPVPNVNPTVTINVDAAANRHLIDPRIYGVAFADTTTINDLSLPLNRWGGNTTSRYNWANSTANHARDYFFENIPDTNDGGANGESADAFISLGSKPIITIPVTNYMPRAPQKECAYTHARYPACCTAFADTHFEPADCGNGFSTIDGNRITVNDPNDVETYYADPVTFQSGWVQHLVAAHGSAAAGGVKYYAIDNEPDLWDSTHFDIHPAPSTYDEIGGALTNFAPMIQSNDPSALLMGPEVSGWAWYFDSAFDIEKQTQSDINNHGGVYFVPWYLQQAKSYEQANGVRILDVLSLHWYPQGLRTVPGGPITNQEYDPSNPADEVTTATKTLRNQSTRSLWDPIYIDKSWIHDLGYENNEPHLIPLLRDWVNTYYPGTQIGITEYNWGAEKDPNGATAQAEILGIFGREGLDLATRWMSPPAGSNVYNAYKMFRNYDGAQSMFGDLSVSCAEANGDIDNVSSFAALRSSDGALTIMVMAKRLIADGDTPVTINLANFVPSGAVAHYWQLSSANVIAQQPDVTIAGGNMLTFTANPETVNLFVIPTSLIPPKNVNALASGTTVNLTWNGAAANYNVYRSTSIYAPYMFVGNAGAANYSDAGLTADTTYLYRVASVNVTAISALSALDAATTTTFTDDPLTAGTTAKAAHITQLRTAVNAMRTAAGIGVQTFTDSPLSAGVAIKATHIAQLRTALDQARSALGLGAIGYVDPAITPAVTKIKAAHITDLRNGVK